VLGIIIVTAMYRVKYEVGALEVSMKRLTHEITQNKETIHVLKAEWNHLNDPKRLQNSCAKYLPDLKPVHSKQLITLQDMLLAGGQSSSDKNLDTYMTSLLENELNEGEGHT
jgi:hypothetical protein